MLKREEITNENSCMNKAEDDEPVFVIRAKDPIGSFIVKKWCEEAAKHKVHEPEKIEEAKVLCNEMWAWRENWRVHDKETRAEKAATEE